MRIALVHLCAFGDCLYATLVAKQIKQDFPGCHLTWVIADKYASVLKCNPDVDKVETVAASGVAEAISTVWQAARNNVELRLASGELDRAFYTQINPDNRGLCDGMIRSTIYRCYGRPVAGPHRPVLVLDEAEKQRVEEFAATHSLRDFRHVFLFESSPRSGQSTITPECAETIAKSLTAAHPDVAFCLSSDRPIAQPSPQVIDASTLTFRENAALSHHCTGLVGCSSGITWVTTSTAGKLLPMLQILTNATTPFQFASVSFDFQRFGLDSNLVIELRGTDDAQVLACLETWIVHSHEAAFARFHQPVRLQGAHAAGVYDCVRAARGRGAAIAAVCRFVAAHGVCTIPWVMIPDRLTAAARRALRTLGLLPLAKALLRIRRSNPAGDRRESPIANADE